MKTVLQLVAGLVQKCVVREIIILVVVALIENGKYTEWTKLVP